MKPGSEPRIRARPQAIVEMLGASLECEAQRALSCAPSRETVVITGEAGVGKSLLAAFMHAAGPNNDRPLESINIATSGDRHQRLSLLGADFSSLTSSKRSLLERPSTVVVKHIDQAYHSLQESLAKAIASKTVCRPGSIRTKPVRCRVILTLRRSLAELVEHATLHESLAQIIASAPVIHISPLRERPSDLTGLIRTYYGRSLPSRLERAIVEYPWPGNLAELRAALECLKPLTSQRSLPDRCRSELHQMLLHIEEGTEFSLRRSLAVIERGMIHHALKKTDGHRARAAQLLGLTDTAVRWHMDRIRNSS